MNKEKLKKKIFEEIYLIKKFPSLLPFIVSIGPVPIRPNFRRLYSYPKIVRLFVDYLAPIVRKTKANIIIGGATAGIPLAMALSLKTNLPFLYVRKQVKLKKGLSHGFIEGDYQPGDKAILVEDILSKGDTKVRFIRNLERNGIRVRDIMVMIKTNNKLHPALRKKIKQKKVKVHHVITWPELTQKQIAAGIIPRELAPMVLDYVKNPETWENNYKKWHQYCQALRKLKMPVPKFLKKYE